MKSTLDLQQGMSFPIVVILVAFTAFVGMFALKVGPTYIEYLTVSKIAEETASNPEVMRQPRSKVLAYIDKAYRTNNLWDLTADETVVLKKGSKSGYTVNVDYEKRSQLFGNIHVVTVFQKTVGAP